MERELIFFGTGTSHGVPVMGCNCKVCRSADIRDKRFRASLLYVDEAHRLLIDCGPDFRQQYLSYGRNKGLDAVLLTHIHYDHVGGLDDLRPFSYANGFDVYASQDVISNIRIRNPYFFTHREHSGLPRLRFHNLMPFVTYDVKGIDVTPFTVMHGAMPIMGYKLGNDVAYMTDASSVPEETQQLLQGIEVLVINALRHREHPGHMNIVQALNVIKLTGAKRAYLTHMSHEAGSHDELSKTLPSGVQPAFDGLTVKL